MSDNMTATTTSSTVTETDQNNQSAEGTPQLFSDELLQREILCETKEGDKIPVRISLLLQSKTFGTMWKDLNMSDGDQLNDFVFPIKAIPTQIFNKVILWLREHVGQPEPVIEEDPNTRERKWFTLNEWEQEFYKVELEELAELLIASNFLNIPSLYLFGCQTMAALIKEKTPEEIREMFGLEDDLSEEEKAEIRRKNVWCNY